MTTTDVPPDTAVLLPGDDEAPRCATFTAEHGFAPQGNGLDVAMVVFAEVPLPWPKPVFAHEWLDGLTNTFDSPAGQARIFATHPSPTSGDVVKVTCWWRDGGGVDAAVLATDREHLHDCLAGLAEVLPDRSPYRTDQPVASRAVAVCTQGSHDVCCGSAGSRLATEIESTRPDIGLFRISHTGGHRYAPTVLTLPDGRMWAHMTIDDVEAVVDRSGDAATLADRCRGWWGAPAGHGQAAEVAVFARQGWAFDDQARAIEVDPVDDDGSARCQVRAGDATWDVEVTTARMVPTITCRAPGGEPVKLAPELAATVLD